VIGRDQLIWFARIEAEMDNLRAALEWAAGDGTDRKLRLAAALAHCWLNRGYQGEALGRLVGALDRGSPAPTRERSTVLDWAGFMELNRGNRARGRGMGAAAAAVAPAANDKPALATALRRVAMFAWNEEGPSAHLRAALDEAIAYALSDED